MHSQDLWQVQVDNRVYEALTDELVEWIKEGSVLPEDKVRKGNLRWLAAQRIPQFNSYFSDPPKAEKRSSSESGNSGLAFEIERNGTVESPLLNNYSDGVDSSFVGVQKPSEAFDEMSPPALLKHCFKHQGQATKFICNVCRIPYCVDCTNRFGSVRLCPTCGGMCVSFVESEKVDFRASGALNKPYARKVLAEASVQQADGTLGIRDLVHAARYALSPRIESVVYIALFIFLFFGVSLLFIGGTVVSLVALFSTLGLATLMLRISRKARAHADPLSAERLSDDKQIVAYAVKDFTLGVIVNLTSFGIFFLVISMAAAYAWYRVSTTLDVTDAAIRIEQKELDATLQANGMKTGPRSIDQKINETRNQIITSTFGKGVISEEHELDKLVKSIMRLSIFLLMPIFIAFLFGLVYYPAAIGLALRNLSVRETLNFRQGLRLIRIMGFEYVKITLASMTLLLLLGGISILSTGVLSYFWQDSIAVIVLTITLPAIASFYCWSFFSSILAFSTRVRQVQI